MEQQKNPCYIVSEEDNRLAKNLSDNDLDFKEIQNTTNLEPTPVDFEQFIPFLKEINDKPPQIIPKIQKDDDDNDDDDRSTHLTDQSKLRKQQSTMKETTFVFMVSCVFWVFVCVIIGLVIFLVIFSYSYSRKNITSFQFEGYSVIVDLDNSVPISSTMKILKTSESVKTPSIKSCSRFENIQGFSITTDDYKTITQTPFPSGTDDKYDRGHLSPYADIGDPSCKIVNIVPQLRCHNQQVWQQFETYIREKFSIGEEIVTFPLYNFTSFAPTEHGRLYIPYKICKRIRNVDYCIPHHSGVCSKSWQDVIQPKFPY